jgi:hypothetical protein
MISSLMTTLSFFLREIMITADLLEMMSEVCV